MDISFRSKKFGKDFNEWSRLQKIHGKKRAEKIRIRLGELRAASSLYDFWPTKSGPSRCHELTGGKRKGQVSVDLDHPYRLIFIPDHEPFPVKPDGGLDWKHVTAIVIIGIEDTHE